MGAALHRVASCRRWRPALWPLPRRTLQETRCSQDEETTETAVRRAVKRGHQRSTLPQSTCRSKSLSARVTAVNGSKSTVSCSSSDGGACSNKTRVRRDTLEREIIGPIKDRLLDPEQVKRMAKRLEKRLAEQAKATQQKGADAPRELAVPRRPV